MCYNKHVKKRRAPCGADQQTHKIQPCWLRQKMKNIYTVEKVGNGRTKSWDYTSKRRAIDVAKKLAERHPTHRVSVYWDALPGSDAIALNEIIIQDLGEDIWW